MLGQKPFQMPSRVAAYIAAHHEKWGILDWLEPPAPLWYGRRVWLHTLLLIADNDERDPALGLELALDQLHGTLVAELTPLGTLICQPDVYRAGDAFRL